MMLSVVIVNHNSSDLLKDCLTSIISTNVSVPFEFVIVDSGSNENDVRDILSLEADNVKVSINKENIGYAMSVNQGVKAAKGDIILISNPDIVYKANSLNIMISALSELPRCGAVGPKTWWNKGMTFLLPVSEIITPYWLIRAELMRISSFARDKILKGWIRKNLKYLLSQKPIQQEMLSGACIMIKRKIFESLGGFDGSFRLYFEDTDLCLRVQKAGYRLYMLPEAKIIHYYNQSAKQDKETSNKKYEASMIRYMEKHFKEKLLIPQIIQRFLKKRSEASFNWEYRGNFTDTTPDFTFHDNYEKLFLLSPVESLIPSACSFFNDAAFAIPADLWEILGEGRYFAKAFNLHTLKSYGSWCWDKRNH